MKKVRGHLREVRVERNPKIGGSRRRQRGGVVTGVEVEVVEEAEVEVEAVVEVEEGRCLPQCRGNLPRGGAWAP